jgi:hypothetical protein
VGQREKIKQHDPDSCCMMPKHEDIYHGPNIGVEGIGIVVQKKYNFHVQIITR